MLGLLIMKQVNPDHFKHKRDTINSIAAILQNHSFFKDRKLTIESVVDIINRFKLFTMKKYQEVTRYGTQGSDWFLILNGVVEI